MASGQLIFISGGVRSGKSTFAEYVATRLAVENSELKLHYIACGENCDDEMAKRIAQHQEVRHNNLVPWKSWECPRNLLQLLAHFNEKDIILIDCLTTWLSNELFNFFCDDEFKNVEIQNAIKLAILKSIKCLRENAHSVIIVSNEILNEPLSEHAFTFTYAKMLGQLHQAIVREASQVYLAEFGINRMIKGMGINE